jgi:hypothetical protein
MQVLCFRLIPLPCRILILALPCAQIVTVLKEGLITMTATREEIAILLDQFREETKHFNSLSGIETLPSSVAMIAIGEPMVHYIFQESVPLTFNLMVLLKALTGFEPPQATLEVMRQDWLNWASQNHHL